MMEKTTMENEVERPPASNSPTTPRLDLLGTATLVGVIVMLAITAVNVWHVSRLTERLVRMEAAMAGAEAIRS